MNEMVKFQNATGMTGVEQSQEIATIQGKMFLARQFPRDIESARQRIALECKNRNLAEKAVYQFPRGDSVVEGASIRLVECVARHWGNLSSGIKELSTDGKKATVKAYCWDLETNFCDEKIFDVAMTRTTRKGSYELTDDRDRYEMMANMAARRKRACMQAIIPQFVIDEAVEMCKKTLNSAITNVEEAKGKMLAAFRAIAEWITEEDFATVCGRPFANLGSNDIVKLRGLYNAIKEGYVKPEVAFKKEEEKPAADAKDDAALDEVNDLFGGATDAGE